MKPTDHLQKRGGKLEQNGDSSMPELFVSWGRDAGLSEAEIRTDWVSIVAEAGGDDPMTVVWDRSLKGELFDGGHST